MGMFGLFYVAAQGLLHLVAGAHNTVVDENLRHTSSSDGITYHDHKGTRRLVSNNHWCESRFNWDSPGLDWCLYDMDKGIIVHNYSDDWRKRDNENLLKHGIRFERIENDPHLHDGSRIRGHKYRNLDDGKIYWRKRTPKRFGETDIFMNEEGFAVSPWGYENKYIDKFNENQKSLIRLGYRDRPTNSLECNMFYLNGSEKHWIKNPLN